MDTKPAEARRTPVKRLRGDGGAEEERPRPRCCGDTLRAQSRRGWSTTCAPARRRSLPAHLLPMAIDE